jgi:hypothetical protein
MTKAVTDAAVLVDREARFDRIRPLYLEAVLW